MSTATIYLDIPLIPTDDDGGPVIHLRLERAENAKGYGYQANFYEDGEIFLSAGLRFTEPMFFWAYLHHVSAGAIALPDCYAALAGLGLHQTALDVQAYNADGRSPFEFRAWCDGGALFVGWGWAASDAPRAPIHSARLDEAGLTALRQMAQDMIDASDL